MRDERQPALAEVYSSAAALGYDALKTHHELDDAIHEVQRPLSRIEGVSTDVRARSQIFDYDGRDRVEIHDFTKLGVIDRGVEVLIRHVKLADVVEHARLVERSLVCGNETASHEREFLKLRVRAN